MQSEGYKNRQNFEMENWPELRESMNNIFKLIFPSREVSGDAIVTGASICIGMAFSAGVLADQIKITSKGSKVAVFVARDEVRFFV